MSVKVPGARTWSARSTTVTRAGTLLVVLLATAPAAADALDRVLDAAHAVSAAPLPGRDELTRACGGDLLCSARRIAEVLGARARLQSVRHPDTDTIRWVATRPSIRVHEEGGTLRVEILRLGRKVLAELEAALVGASSSESTAIVLDLRQTRGGGFARMLEVASWFVGARPAALALVESGRASWIDLPAPATTTRARVDTVMVGRATASAGEVLAALLASPGGARLCGREPTAGEAKLKAVIPVHHDWRLVVERAEIVVPPYDLRHGLRPSGACRGRRAVRSTGRTPGARPCKDCSSSSSSSAGSPPRRSPSTRPRWATW